MFNFAQHSAFPEHSFILHTLPRIISPDFLSIARYLLFFTILLSCLFISLLGISKSFLSLTILLIITIDRSTPSFIFYCQQATGTESTNLLQRELQKLMTVILNLEKENPMAINISIIVISFLIAWIISFLHNNLLYLGMAVIGFFVYQEFLKDNFSEANKVKLLLFVVIMVIIFMLMKRVLYLVLAIAFGTIGPYLGITEVEYLFGKDWGFKELKYRLGSLLEMDKQTVHQLVFVIGCCVCVLYQSTKIVKGKV